MLFIPVPMHSNKIIGRWKTCLNLLTNTIIRMYMFLKAFSWCDGLVNDRFLSISCIRKKLTFIEYVLECQLMPFVFSAGLTPCFKERYDALGLDRIPPPGRFIPKCTQLGEYKRLQCSGSTGYCWCVERNGKEIRGTRKRGSPPHCLKDGKSSITIPSLTYLIGSISVWFCYISLIFHFLY